LCISDPEDMVSYLVHLNQNNDVPIQARIFQEYIKLIENALPISFYKNGEEIEILSINDPNLALFAGKSIFSAKVKENGFIPNGTIETYIGSRENKMYGICSIGKLISIVDDNGKSLLDQVISYNFTGINTNLAIGTNVVVTHFRLLPHYEIGHMVCLQRTRKRIITSIGKRIKGII